MLLNVVFEALAKPARVDRCVTSLASKDTALKQTISVCVEIEMVSCEQAGSFAPPKTP
jgi:hypothetical protein